MSDNIKDNEFLDTKDDGSQRKKIYLKKKVCRFCNDKNLKIDYKDVDTLRRFVTEGGKILPKRITGNCSKHQRKVAEQIKIARAIALLPYLKK
ncbi:MAG TPA: 30S ribosomal protein S18 [Spirochaetota bacterium]|nr:30S ribosomal protein S18 [Spirochaetota bacterium]HOL56395.1 30S ribosomal protein S18 [Spirochaetota bacterium]HPP05278.1 30S ribosomal protein S18 [Spirochaetota bacterium]